MSEETKDNYQPNLRYLMLADILQKAVKEAENLGIYIDWIGANHIDKLDETAPISTAMKLFINGWGVQFETVQVHQSEYNPPDVRQKDKAE